MFPQHIKNLFLVVLKPYTTESAAKQLRIYETAYAYDVIACLKEISPVKVQLASGLLDTILTTRR